MAMILSYFSGFHLPKQEDPCNGKKNFNERIIVLPASNANRSVTLIPFVIKDSETLVALKMIQHFPKKYVTNRKACTIVANLIDN